MNKTIKTLLKGMAFVCVFFVLFVNAGEALASINAAVDTQAEQIDQKHGVLLTNQERNNLKMALIVKKVTTDTANDSSKTVKEKTDSAIATYEINDPVEQRQLLIEIEAAANTGGGAANTGGGSGNKPPCCD